LGHITKKVLLSERLLAQLDIGQQTLIIFSVETVNISVCVRDCW